MSVPISYSRGLPSSDAASYDTFHFYDRRKQLQVFLPLESGLNQQEGKYEYLYFLFINKYDS